MAQRSRGCGKAEHLDTEQVPKQRPAAEQLLTSWPFVSKKDPPLSSPSLKSILLTFIEPFLCEVAKILLAYKCPCPYEFKMFF